MAWHPERTPRARERRHYYAQDLPAEAVGRFITVGGQTWPLRGVLLGARFTHDHPEGTSVELRVRGRDGRERVAAVEGDTGVLIHAERVE